MPPFKCYFVLIYIAITPPKVTYVWPLYSLNSRALATVPLYFLILSVALCEALFLHIEPKTK